MGTRFELVLHGDDDVQLRSAGECALAEIERLHTQLTNFSDDSLLTHINRTAAKAAVRLDAETFALFQDALHVYRASDGAFDCTLGTGMDCVLLNRGTHSIRFDRHVVRDHGSGIKDQGPGIGDDCSEKDERANILLIPIPRSPIPDPRSNNPDPRSSNPDPRSLIPDPILDLGAIAKGHALNCAAGILRDHEVSCALLHGGTSSVLALDAPPGESAWRIALANHPQRLTIDLCNAALSVSCTLGDRRHNVGHIVDPRGQGSWVRGQGPPGLMGERYSAVLGPSARLADAWSTALIVLGHRPATLGAEWQSWLW
jgi:FAD:protein FMN transferase